MKILVTGGAGFLGAHLVEQLLALKHHVTVADCLWTGSSRAISKFTDNPHFVFLKHDVTFPFPEDLHVDQIYHLASAASPERFIEDPLRILRTCFIGTMNVFELAKRCDARVLIASTSEIYGSTTKFPQSESDWGYANSFGPRSCYDEGKRVAEAMAYGYRASVEVRIARIFNTYGPGLPPKDGRVVSNFISASLSGQPITIFGDGKATRCFQFVSDCVRGLIMLMASEMDNPVNIGSDTEVMIEDLAKMVQDLVVRRGLPENDIIYKSARGDDPVRRKPDITLATKKLGWSPRVELFEGLEASIDWYAQVLTETNGHSETNRGSETNCGTDGGTNGEMKVSMNDGSNR